MQQLPSRMPASPQSLTGQSNDAKADVWTELFGTVDQLHETVELSLQAMSPETVVAGGDKAVSATTKKRIMVKSYQALKESRGSVQVLQEHLKALQAASQQWQKTMMYASKSHEELMDQLESTNRDLQHTTNRLRALEVQHEDTIRENDAQRQHILKIESDFQALKGMLRQKEEDLETSQFAHEEAAARVRQAQGETEAAQKLQHDAEQERDRAVSALDGVKAEAEKAHATAARQQEALAKLTADNLVFLMSLKKAEADLAVALQEKAQLKLAAEKQRGPWFDEVRASVEERIKQAMSTAATLESEMEVIKKQHAQQLQEIMSEKADLEEFLAKMKAREEELEKQVADAQAARDAADARSATARSTADNAAQHAEELSMRNSVLQDHVKSMRQECTERWVSEQAALGKVQGLEDSIASLQALVTQLQDRLSEIQQHLDTQLAVNRQLMTKKEEVEWQLMAAVAKGNLPNTMTSAKPTPARVTSMPFATPSQPQQPQQQGHHAPPNTRNNTLPSHPLLLRSPASATASPRIPVQPSVVSRSYEGAPLTQSSFVPSTRFAPYTASPARSSIIPSAMVSEPYAADISTPTRTVSTVHVQTTQAAVTGDASVAPNFSNQQQAEAPIEVTLAPRRQQHQNEGSNTALRDGSQTLPVNVHIVSEVDELSQSTDKNNAAAHSSGSDAKTTNGSNTRAAEPGTRHTGASLLEEKKPTSATSQSDAQQQDDLLLYTITTGSPRKSLISQSGNSLPVFHPAMHPDLRVPLPKDQSTAGQVQSPADSFHPAMHPSLLIGNEQQVGASFADEITHSGGGRRFSAASVTTTPIPAHRRPAAGALP